MSRWSRDDRQEAFVNCSCICCTVRVTAWKNDMVILEGVYPRQRRFGWRERLRRIGKALQGEYVTDHDWIFDNPEEFDGFVRQLIKLGEFAWPLPMRSKSHAVTTLAQQQDIHVDDVSMAGD